MRNKKPNLVTICCHLTGGRPGPSILLSQIAQWHPYARKPLRNREGYWIANDYPFWMKFTAMSKDQVSGAFRQLTRMGLIRKQQALFGNRNILHTQPTPFVQAALGVHSFDDLFDLIHLRSLISGGTELGEFAYLSIAEMLDLWEYGKLPASSSAKIPNSSNNKNSKKTKEENHESASGQTPDGTDKALEITLKDMVRKDRNSGWYVEYLKEKVDIQNIPYLSGRNGGKIGALATYKLWRDWQSENNTAECESTDTSIEGIEAMSVAVDWTHAVLVEPDSKKFHLLQAADLMIFALEHWQEIEPKHKKWSGPPTLDEFRENIDTTLIAMKDYYAGSKIAKAGGHKGTEIKAKKFKAST